MRKLIKCIVWIQIVAVIALTAFNTQAENVALPDTTLDSSLLQIAEKGNLEMYLDSDTCLYIKDKYSGTYWCSAPESRNSSFIDENILAEMSSLICVSYVNNKNVYFSATAKQSSVDTKTYKIKKYKDNSGAVIEYSFTKNNENFIIPLKLQLNDASTLTVEILYDEIKENGDFRIVSIDLLPYMLSGNGNEDGYLLIPDGCGAIMRFKDKKTTAQKYEKTVYGRDYALNLLKDTTDEQEILLPVFGCSKEDSGLLCIIEGSEANATINAVPNGYTSDCAAAWASFNYRGSDTTTLADKDYNSRSVSVISDIIIDENPKLQISFLSGDDCGYNAMASLYRNYLQDKENMSRIEETESSLYLQVMGAVKKSSNFLGIPINKTVTATDFDDVSKIVQALEEEGVTDIEVMLYGFLKGGMYGKYTSKPIFDSKVGGKKGFRNMLADIEETGNSVTVMFDMINVYSGKLAFLNAAKMLDKQTMYQTRYFRSTGAKDESFKWFIIKPEGLSKNVNRLLEYLDKNEISSVGLIDMGRTLYSDYNKSNVYLRHKSQAEIQKLLKETAQKTEKCIIEGGNLYTLLSSATAIEIPVTASDFDCFSESIPFYQMVLHGLARLAGEAVNYQADSDTYFLQCVQTGTDIVYMLTGNDSSVYSESKLSFVYNSYYKNHTEEIKEKYIRYKDAFKGLKNQFIVNFERQDDITVTTFENGVKIICNFSSQQQSYNGQAIEPLDFAVVS